MSILNIPLEPIVEYAAFRVHSDDLEVPLPLLQVASRPRHRPTSPDTANKSVQLSISLSPDFRPCSPIVRHRIHLVRVLVGHETVRRFTRQSLGNSNVMFGRVSR